MRYPVGSPFSSLVMMPPSGSGVSRVMFAISSALLLTQAEWCETSKSRMGLSGQISSSSFLFGPGLLPSSSWNAFTMNGLPVYASRSGCAATKSEMIFTYSSTVVASPRYMS